MKESKLVGILTALIDLIWAGLLWLLCSLPVLTLGASTTALYYTIVKSVRHERSHVGTCFFHAFRSNFRQATVLWLLFLGYALLGTADAWALQQMGIQRGDLLYYLSRFFFLPLPLLFPWVFAFLSRFENTVPGTLRYCFYLAMRHTGRTLALAAELIIFLLICYLLPFFLLILPGAMCMLMSLHIEPVFREMTAGQDGEDAWYNE